MLTSVYSIVSFALFVLLSDQVVNANGSVHANKYGAGQVHNTQVSRALIAASAHLQGKFYIQNLATQQWLSYKQRPQTIHPAPKSQRSSIILSRYGPGTRVKPSASNNKCLASQFHSETGVDWAATMYVCSQLNTPHVDAGNPTNKQQWLFIPVHGQNQVYHLVAVDHMTDMQTRALSSRTLQTAGGYISTSIDLYNTRDKSQMWKVIKA